MFIDTVCIFHTTRSPNTSQLLHLVFKWNQPSVSLLREKQAALNLLKDSILISKHSVLPRDFHGNFDYMQFSSYAISILLTL